MSKNIARRGALALGMAALSACAMPERLAAVPRGSARRATVLGVPNERFFPGLGTGPITAEFMSAVERRRAHLGIRAGDMAPPLELLAVSGGGEDGAFGAGLLNGWSEHGTRPEFSLVTGVSTGALTAPFAFLGSEYDQGLRAVYTNVTMADIVESRGLTAALFNDALADTLPLFRTISREVDQRMLDKIGQAYREGRLLLLGTTDLDAQMPVIWNIGAIAASGHPGALNLVRRIMLASASIPGAFPPVMFDVTVDGVPHQELHVDGGAIHQAFLYPVAITAARRARIARRQPVQPIRAYLIRNARMDPGWASTDRRFLSIAQRAVETMIFASGFNDSMRMWLNSQRDDVDFNLAFIGPDFNATFASAFDQVYMRALFDYAYQRARVGYNWSKSPPMVE